MLMAPVEWLKATLPTQLLPVLEWMLEPAVMLTFAAISVLMFVLSVVGVPAILARLPADYFSHHERQTLGLLDPTHPWWYRLLHVLKNVVGLVLLSSGLVFFLLPGQGLLTIFLSLFLLDFPGKRRAQRRIVSSPRLLRTINHWRLKAGRQPLEGFETHPAPAYRPPAHPAPATEAVPVKRRAPAAARLATQNAGGPLHTGTPAYAGAGAHALTPSKAVMSRPRR